MIRQTWVGHEFKVGDMDHEYKVSILIAYPPTAVGLVCCIHVKFMPMLAPNQGHKVAKLTTFKLVSLNPSLTCQKLFDNSCGHKYMKQRLLLNIVRIASFLYTFTFLLGQYEL